MRNSLLGELISSTEHISELALLYSEMRAILITLVNSFVTAFRGGKY